MRGLSKANVCVACLTYPLFFNGVGDNYFLCQIPRLYHNPPPAPCLWGGFHREAKKGGPSCQLVATTKMALVSSSRYLVGKGRGGALLWRLCFLIY